MEYFEEYRTKGSWASCDERVGWIPKGPEMARIKDIVLWVEWPCLCHSNEVKNSVTQVFIALQDSFSRGMVHRLAL